MTVQGAALPAPGRVGLSAAVELLKPITWFAPMWAFGCGVVSSGVPVSGQWPLVLAGVALAGPLVCGTSQAANDWYDRHVDAINEPHRPIPSGRLPGRTGLYIAIGWTGVSLLVAALLGPWAFGAALVGVALAWLALAGGAMRGLRLRARFTRRRATAQGADARAGEEVYCVLFMEDVRVVEARTRQEKLAAMGRVSAGIAAL